MADTRSRTTDPLAGVTAQRDVLLARALADSRHSGRRRYRDLARWLSAAMTTPQPTPLDYQAARAAHATEGWRPWSSLGWLARHRLAHRALLRREALEAGGLALTDLKETHCG